MAFVRGLTAFALCAGCIDPGTVTCDNGLVCPSDTTCVALSADETICATRAELKACNDLAAGDECTLDVNAPASCVSGVCLPTICGDARIGPGEVCDDGDTVTGDGNCSADCLSDETCGNGIVDPTVLDGMGMPQLNEECDDHNLISGDGCSSACASESARWSQVDGRQMPALSGYDVAYDSGRRRIVVFGGYLGPGYSKEVHEWTGTVWVHPSPANSPQPRADAMLAYDAARHRTVLFGGTPGGARGPFGDTWEWDGEQWTLREPAQSPPSRAYGGMVYDSARKKIVLFGGFDGTHNFNDTWEWDGTNWTQPTVTGSPGGRFGHVMGYDPKRGVIVVAGGTSKVDEDAVGVPLGDTWELGNGTWRMATTAPPELGGITPSSGSNSRLASMTYDIAGSRFLAYAQSPLNGTNQTWQYASSTWTALATSAQPGQLVETQVFTDAASQQVLLYGGNISSTTENLMWRWTGSAWTAVTGINGTRPSLLEYRGVGYDPRHRRVWLFGGTDPSDTASAELMSFDGATWTRYTPAGPTPGVRAFAMVAYDRKRDRLVLFGGNGASGLAPAETWLFDGTTWAKQTTPTTPSARLGGLMTYDARRDRVVLFGGAISNSTLADTWEWDGTAWSQVTTTTAPSPRGLTGFTYDEARGVTVLTTGIQVTASGPALVEDTWTYDGTAWTKVNTINPFVLRLYTSLGYDPAARSSTLFGAFAVGGLALDDTWSWNGSWHQVVVPSPQPRGALAAFSSLDGAGTLFQGGGADVDSGATFDEVWRLRYENNDPRELCTGDHDNDGDGLAGCADPDCWFRCAPSCPPGAACDTAAPHCGDGTCSSVEDCRICPGDCMCGTAVCGDTFCDSGETLAACPGDCTP